MMQMQGSLYYQPKQCIIIRELLKSTIHLDALIAPKMGNEWPPGKKNDIYI